MKEYDGCFDVPVEVLASLDDFFEEFDLTILSLLYSSDSEADESRLPRGIVLCLGLPCPDEAPVGGMGILEEDIMISVVDPLVRVCAGA